MSKYIHEEFTHNLRSPQEIVPLIISYFRPSSVVDVGCGLGTFLKVFKDKGVKTILGIEGSWVDKSLLFKNISDLDFKEANLEEELKITERFDIALSLEVAEHLSEEYAETLVKNLISLSDTIIFSAAFPSQGGQNHLNEQWPSYWQAKFQKYGFIFYDIFRDEFWNNSNVDWWYKQNMFLVSSRSDFAENIRNKRCNVILNYFHPQLYLKRTVHLENIISGRFSSFFYLKLLVKSFFNKKIKEA